MLVQSSRVGEVEVLPTELIHFSAGVVGLPDWQDAVLIPVAEVPLLCWLQFLHDPDAAFLLLNIGALYPDYDLNKAREHSQLGPLSKVYTIVKVPGGDFGQATTNLMAPLVIEQPADATDKKRTGIQVVLHDSNYSLRHPLFGGDKAC